jgi:CBS-domain-containing membrane protein
MVKENSAMRRFIRAFDPEFRPHWASYVVQSALGTATIFAAIHTLRQQNLLVAASLAATAFTIFVMPSSVPAKPRNVAGGHMVGLVFGCVFASVAAGAGVWQDAMYALAVGCSIFVMAITNTEHPPAAGTALGVVIAGYSIRVVMGVAIGVTILAVIHGVLKPYLRDLIATADR